MRRTSFFILLFVLSYWSESVAIDAPTNLRIQTGQPPVFSQDFSIPRSVSRSSGVAPLSVHFTAGFSNSSPTERGFHNYDYFFNFGDPSSGNWGTTKKPKNVAKGPIAAHVYETPGSYTVTLTVRDASGVVDTATCNITVTDPDIVYSGTNTTCVCDTTQNDFTECPAGARQVATDDLSTITGCAGAGKRILFHRGSSWTSSGTDFPDNSGPVTIGAYGACSSPDDLGICSNAPQITITAGSFCDLSRKQNWRFSDIYFSGGSDVGGVFGGVYDMQRILMLRLKTVGFSVPIGISHWKDSADELIDQIMLVSSDVSNSGNNCLYVGAERLALIGNKIYNAMDSHVVRVWQGYLGVISHNIISGSSIDSTTGRHALKLHGSRESEVNPEGIGLNLNNRTTFVVVSNNVFGSSGPWPVTIGTQDGAADQRVNDIIFEKNRIHPDYGAQSSRLVQVALNIWGRYYSIRNNIIDGTGASNYFTAINVSTRGVEPAPVGVEIYNNTIYRSDVNTTDHKGFLVENSCTDTIIINNFVSFPNVTGAKILIMNSSADLVQSNNILTSTPSLVNPDLADPLSRDYTLQVNSSPDEAGISNVPICDDYYSKRRLQDGAYDIGAIEN